MCNEILEKLPALVIIKYRDSTHQASLGFVFKPSKGKCKMKRWRMKMHRLESEWDRVDSLD